MNTEYTLSNQELFFIVAQTVWDTFLIFLFSLGLSYLFALFYTIIQHHTNKGKTNE